MKVLVSIIIFSMMGFFVVTSFYPGSEMDIGSVVHVSAYGWPSTWLSIASANGAPQDVDVTSWYDAGLSLFILFLLAVIFHLPFMRKQQSEALAEETI